MPALKPMLHQCIPVVMHEYVELCIMSAMFKGNTSIFKHLLDFLPFIMLAIPLENKYNDSCANKESLSGYFLL